MAFNMSDFFNSETKKEIKADWKPIRISVHKLRPAAGKENFYHIDDKEIEETARTIELVGLQQYPVVKPIADTDEYEVIAGHKRRLAILKLMAEGKEQFEMVPCKLENTEDSIRNRLILIFTNSTQRERSDYEKIQEIKEIKELLTEWSKDNKLPGKMQSIIAEILGTNKTKVGTLENIEKNMIQPFMEEYAAGKISTSAANEIAGLIPEAQQALYETYQETGSLIARDAKILKEDAKTEQVEGQRNIYQFPEYLPDGMATQGEQGEKPEEGQADTGNVSAKGQQDKAKQQRELPEATTEPWGAWKDGIDRTVPINGHAEPLKAPEQTRNREHVVKVSGREYGCIIRGEKAFKLIKNNQDFRENDSVEFWKYENGIFSERKAEAHISAVEEDVNGLKDEYCIIGFQLMHYDLE